MSRSEAISAFRRIYPEREVTIISADPEGDNWIITAGFPDGTFYFVVEPHTVSCSYNSLSAAKSRV